MVTENIKQISGQAMRIPPFPSPGLCCDCFSATAVMWMWKALCSLLEFFIVMGDIAAGAKVRKVHSVPTGHLAYIHWRGYLESFPRA